MRRLAYFLLSLVLLLSSTLSFGSERTSLVVANSKAWKPYSYLDEKGEPKGILVDLWNAYGSANNVDVEFKLVDWGASIELVREGKADVHAGLLWSQQRSDFFSFGPAIVSLDTQLYFNNSLSTLDPISLLAGEEPHVIGVVADSYEVDFIKTQFPKAKLKEYANNLLMIEAAFSGKIDVFAADLLVANYYIHAASRQTDFFPAKFLYSGDLHFAVAHGNEALLKSVSDQFNNVSQEDSQRIMSKWMHIETVYPKYMFAFLILLTFAVLIGYVVSLRFAVKAKTQQLAKANEELTLLAKTDALTGIYNRRSLFDFLNDNKGRHAQVTVMVFDIDDFKRINDSYGHAMGDQVICAVSNATSQILEAGEMFARIGGEEFAVAFVGGSESASLELANRIVQAISTIEVGGMVDHVVTVSLGCVVYTNGHADIHLADADRLMYQAKAQGKNQAVCATL